MAVTGAPSSRSRTEGSIPKKSNTSKEKATSKMRKDALTGAVSVVEVRMLAIHSILLFNLAFNRMNDVKEKAIEPLNLVTS